MSPEHIKLDTPWETPPDHVNEQGVKWWVDKDLTQRARQRLKKTPYAEVTICYVEHPDKHRTRIMVCGQDYLHEDQTLDGMWTRIELLRAACLLP